VPHGEAGIRARVVVSYDGTILQEVPLAKTVTVVGRHPGCDIVIDHPAVSARHMLLRVVNRTVYVEDLASTNGTQVNGVAASNQVIHHLDLVQVGKHKLHFFDDSLLKGRVGGLESTVQTDFERTLMAAHVPELPTADEVAQLREELELTRTMAVPRDASLSLAPQAAARATEVATAEAPLALHVTSGERRGEWIALERANTMIGQSGGDTALVVKRGATYFLARFSGQRAPSLNGKVLGPGTHALSEGDEIQVGGVAFRVGRQ
jgi:hypothetical protein